MDEHLHREYQAMLEGLMCYERQCFLNAHPYQRHDGRVDQANGFYTRHLTTRAGTFYGSLLPHLCQLCGDLIATSGTEGHHEALSRFNRRAGEALGGPESKLAL
jgi:hypothetical protein